MKCFILVINMILGSVGGHGDLKHVFGLVEYC